MLLLVSLPKFPKTWTLRLIIGWYWIYCILVVVAYRASLTAILANPLKKNTIDTLEELSKSELQLSTYNEVNLNLFSTSSDETGQLIGKDMVLLTPMDAVSTSSLKSMAKEFS